MSIGFTIRQLRLTGLAVKPAAVHFQPGLNIISGPSNTGKTYIFQCISYMLGGSKVPKKITVAKDYVYCYLEIETSSGKKYTLKSDLKGGAFQLYQLSIEHIRDGSSYELLSRSHDNEDRNNVSQFLLSLCGLNGMNVKTNAKGAKRGLSYRDLTKFTLVEETKIITDKSPIVTGQYTTETVEKSVFRLILTGLDDSDTIELLSTKEITHRKGKLELLQELIVEIEKEIDSLNLSNFDEDQLRRSEEGIALQRLELSSLDTINRELNEQRIIQYQSRQENNDAKIELASLLDRSFILDKQYDSDAARLASTIEACQLLISEDPESTECPVCHNSMAVDLNNDSIQGILEACNRELAKIGTLKAELSASQGIIKQDLDTVELEISDTTAQISFLDREITARVQHRMDDILRDLKELQAINDRLRNYQQMVSRKNSLMASRDLIANSLIKKNGEADKDTLSSIIFPVTDRMKTILEDCKYPNLNGVSFNEEKIDFVISGEDRELAGKGYRAITYSTFIVAIQDLLSEKSYAIGVPILDSPFVTYRKPEAGDEGISVDLAMDFYRYLAKCGLHQIIILENEEPPSDIESIVNHIVFTQSASTGRYGFIPT